RSMTLGHYVKGLAYLFCWDFESATTCGEEAIKISADPFYTQLGTILLGIALTLNERFLEAEDALQKNVSYSQACGCESIGAPASGMLGLISIIKGKMSEGLKQLEGALELFYETNNKLLIIQYERTLAVVYYQVAAKTSPISFSTMAKNMGFILKNVPSAGKKAEEHFNKAIETAREIGAMTFVGIALYELALLYIAIKKNDKAIVCLTEAIEVLEQCGSERGLKLAKETMASLGE
ncbi:MAG: tetratricopeptide repeat protein, partial [Deltaproteobacteria bacterium]|nr:tetratricopeptide repeat protein [Deltaproteobacteria bacterium]